MTAARRFVLALLAGLLPPLWANATPAEAHDWLERMSDAVHALDYEGRFVYQSGERLEAMHLIHRVRNGTEHERLVTLTGSARKFVREDSAVACLGADGRKVAVGRKAHGRSISPLLSVETGELTRLYEIRLAGKERVAGRSAVQITIDPRDDLRHGYSLYLDEETALPLRTITLDRDGHALAQTMFTELRTGSAIGILESARELVEQLVKPADAQVHDAVVEQRLQPPGWRFLALPEGFRLNAHRRRSVEQGRSLEHFMFSDGLATISVYVEPTGDRPAFDGHSATGPVQVVGSDLGDFQVTAVGEVPQRTLSMLVQSIRRR